MQVDIITKTFSVDVYGFSGFAVNKDYTSTAFRMMDQMWRIVKSGQLKNKGKNIWVYESNDRIFAGVELDLPIPATPLEQKHIEMARYAYYRHVGPYQLLQQVRQEIKVELARLRLQAVDPTVEIYGHWTSDEAKLETEIFISLK